MLAEPTPSQVQSEPPESWVRVLAAAFGVFLVSGMVGAAGGGLLLLGLVALLAGPEAILNYLDVQHEFPELPTEAQALFSKDGLALCSSLFHVPLGIVLLWSMARRPGTTPREYLGLKWPGLRQGLGWGLIILATEFGYRLLVQRLGIPFSEDHRYRETGSIPLFLPLMFVALAVLTPIFEELLFRGYLLEGLRRSRLGEVGAILITAALWAVLHPDIPVRWLGLFLYGSVLALARLRTGSTYLAMLVHAIGNTRAILFLFLANE